MLKLTNQTNLYVHIQSINGDVPTDPDMAPGQIGYQRLDNQPSSIIVAYSARDGEKPSWTMTMHDFSLDRSGLGLPVIHASLTLEHSFMAVTITNLTGNDIYYIDVNGKHYGYSIPANGKCYSMGAYHYYSNSIISVHLNNGTYYTYKSLNAVYSPSGWVVNITVRSR